MQTQARVVVIGGGVVGCSVLFHLAKLGWSDVLLLERKELASGSSWHAAGQIHTIASDPNISRMQGYTIRLYEEIERLSGQSCGLHQTGGFYLASNRNWHEYLLRERSKARSLGLDQEFITLEELAHRHPLVEPKHYISALWDPLDGDLDPSGVVYAYAKAAQHYGARYEINTPVLETNPRADGSWDVVTPGGTVHAEHIVNAGGLWAREVGALAGLALPVQPMEHQYLITEAIPEVSRRTERLPAGIDYEGNIYFRQEGQGMLLGTYEPSSTPWQVERTPADFDHELLPPDLDRIADRLELGFARIPALERAGIKNIINGPFTFGPDGNPLIGPVPGLRNYWAAVGVMAGFCQGGGVGLCLARWMIEGEAGMDVAAMDVARFGSYATPEYGTWKAAENYSRRFVMTFPNETLPVGRRQKTTALYDRLVAEGAVMGDSFGLEHALWFADGPEDAHEEPTFQRPRSHGYVAREMAAVREGVGMIEIANFSKHSFRGPGARAFLDRLCAGKIPQVGRLGLTPMLTAGGKLWGDVSVAALSEDRFMVFGSGAAQEIHRRWFQQHLDNAEVIYENQSDHWHGFAVSGPRSRELVGRLVREDITAMKFMTVRETFVGGVPAILGRISFSGELGFEVYCAPHHQMKLYEQLRAHGEDLGLRLYGARALMALRLEKGWGAWGLDYRADFSAAESGLDRFVDWDKDFIGREAALRERDSGVERKLVVLVLEDVEQDVTGDEAIMHEGSCVGFVSSGGYGHTVGASLAMGYLPVGLCEEGQGVSIEMSGEFVSARVALEALYDPEGLRMRG